MLEPFQIIKSEWKNINLGIRKAKHDYHSFVFSTVSKNSPESRTVILRDFDEHKKAIWFHSDRRSKKILHLEENKNVSALFYDKSRKVQLRISGLAKIDDNFKKALSNIPHASFISSTGINVRDLISNHKIFIDEKSIDQIVKRLS